MEANEAKPRVRPLDPEGAEATPQHRGGHRLAPKAAFIAGALVVLLLVFVFGSGSGTELAQRDGRAGLGETGAVPDITTTTTTLPPRLRDLVPDLDTPLMTVTAGSEAKHGFWLPDERRVRSYPLQGDVTAAGIDAGGSALAWVDRRSGSLLTGPVPGTSISFVDDAVTGFRWHPELAGRLAATLETDVGVDLAVISLGEDLLGRYGRTSRATLAPRSRIVTWGDWGFAVEIPLGDGAAVLILDAAGAPVRAVPGAAITAGGNVILIAGFPDAASAAAADEALAPLAPAPVLETAVVGATLVDHTFTPVRLDLSGQDPGELPVVTVSRDGGRVAMTTITATDRTSITIVDLAGHAPRVVQLDVVADPIGFVGGERNLLALQDRDSGDLLLLDARTGARNRVPVDGRIVAVYL